MRKKCEEILLKLGIAPDLKGFNYIGDAVELINGESERIKITALYEIIASKRNDTYHKVERAIRHCVSRINPASQVFIECMGDVNIVKESNGNMPNGAFLYTLAYRLREE